jgi:hypothetical protein
MRIRSLMLLLLPLLSAPSLSAQQESGDRQSTPMPRATTASGDYMSMRAPDAGGGGSVNVRPGDSFASRRYQVVEPRATTRCTTLPTEQIWRHRDLISEIRAVSRSGLIPVLPVSGDVDQLNDSTAIPSGWKAYGFTVPGKGELEVRLEHPNLGWFRLAMVNKWGMLQQGMLQNLIPKGSPVVTFKNPKGEAQQVFVIADDPGWMSSRQLPYKLLIKRSWDGKKEAPDTLPQVVGIWARHGSLEKRAVPSKPAPAEQAEKGASQP